MEQWKLGSQHKGDEGRRSKSSRSLLAMKLHQSKLRISLVIRNPAVKAQQQQHNR